MQRVGRSASQANQSVNFTLLTCCAKDEKRISIHTAVVSHLTRRKARRGRWGTRDSLLGQSGKCSESAGRRVSESAKIGQIGIFSAVLPATPKTKNGSRWTPQVVSHLRGPK